MNNPTRSTRLARIAAGAFALLLTYLLVAPSPLAIFGDDGANVEESFDRSVSGFLQHLAAYGVFTLLVLLACRTRRGRTIALLLVAAHAGVTEAVQHFVPLRHTDWADLLANAIGIAVGFLTWLIMGPIRKRHTLNVLQPEPKPGGVRPS